MSLAISFLVFSFAIAAILAYAIHRYFPPQNRVPGLVALAAWMTYATAAGLLLEKFNIRPVVVFYLVPLVLWIHALTRTGVGLLIYRSVPLTLLTALQCFWFFVELYLDQLWKLGLLPKTMTFHGANFDVIIGLSAPVMAFLIARRRVSWQVLLAWNVVGLALLANVLVRGILSAPGPLRLLVDDFPNRAIGVFPYSFIPGLMVLLAATLHVVSIRGLWAPSRIAELHD